MRKTFSERHGYKNPREALQIESINDNLKNRLWNNVKIVYIDTLKRDYPEDVWPLTNTSEITTIKKLYDAFFKTHEEPPNKFGELKNNLKIKYFNLEWYEIYDFLEYLPELFNRNISYFYTEINKVLEEENAGYRFIEGLIVQIIDEIEIKEIEEVFETKFTPVKRHLSNALELLSDRENPDYQNSIKESISAVESIVNIVIGRTNVALNRGLNDLPFEIDNNFKQGIIRIYSWTSSADGIRHGAHEGEILSGFDEAKYMLVSCSAFINYLISKYNEED